MRINRRTFLLLGATLATGCISKPGDTGSFGGRKMRVVNAGLPGLYLADGVYTRFRDQGFFLVRRGADLSALSAICTHRNCQLEAEADKTYYCPCHGSTFDADGKVTEGPARRDLPAFDISTNESGELMVKISA